MLEELVEHNTIQKCVMLLGKEVLNVKMTNTSFIKDLLSLGDSGLCHMYLILLN